MIDFMYLFQFQYYTNQREKWDKTIIKNIIILLFKDGRKRPVRQLRDINDVSSFSIKVRRSP